MFSLDPYLAFLARLETLSRSGPLPDQKGEVPKQGTEMPNASKPKLTRRRVGAPLSGSSVKEKVVAPAGDLTRGLGAELVVTLPNERGNLKLREVQDLRHGTAQRTALPVPPLPQAPPWPFSSFEYLFHCLTPSLESHSQQPFWAFVVSHSPHRALQVVRGCWILEALINGSWFVDSTPGLSAAMKSWRASHVLGRGFGKATRSSHTRRRPSNNDTGSLEGSIAKTSLRRRARAESTKTQFATGSPAREAGSEVEDYGFVGTIPSVPRSDPLSGSAAEDQSASGNKVHASHAVSSVRGPDDHVSVLPQGKRAASSSSLTIRHYVCELKDMLEPSHFNSTTSAPERKLAHRDSVLLVLARGTKLRLYGRARIKILMGCVDILGCPLGPMQTFLPLYSSPYTSYAVEMTVSSKCDQSGQHKRDEHMFRALNREIADPHRIEQIKSHLERWHWTSSSTGPSSQLNPQNLVSALVMCEFLEPFAESHKYTPLLRSLDGISACECLNSMIVQVVSNASSPTVKERASGSESSSLTDSDSKLSARFHLWQGWDAMASKLQQNLEAASAVDDRAPAQYWMCVGPKQSGKSMLMRSLATRALCFQTSEISRSLADVDLLWLDVDTGQSEMTAPGFVSLNRITTPILSPAWCSYTKHEMIDARFVGGFSPSSFPQPYMEAVSSLLATCTANQRRRGRSCLVFINTPGWITGFGAEMISWLLEKLPSQATCVVDLSGKEGDMLDLGHSLTPFSVFATSWNTHDIVQERRSTHSAKLTRDALFFSYFRSPGTALYSVHSTQLHKCFLLDNDGASCEDFGKNGSVSCDDTMPQRLDSLLDTFVGILCGPVGVLPTRPHEWSALGLGVVVCVAAEQDDCRRIYIWTPVPLAERPRHASDSSNRVFALVQSATLQPGAAWYFSLDGFAMQMEHLGKRSFHWPRQRASGHGPPRFVASSIDMLDMDLSGEMASKSGYLQRRGLNH
ncbi:Polynucleotide 5'-hydroxyl-kinase GRC3 [Porphyridium purpureum]|uniref:Polynucleotide 5'-hydroxyl-kinase NOL9 n=1 Tax=Porphyridium purpureum TaxID=35688 RepID=A0A5J4Z0U8_PORPP|nr:Polynucleotide 5'-hydroxyl-kinase GRC3 [Porphyridium purpureum]|eukprot:POR8703..scf208_2